MDDADSSDGKTHLPPWGEWARATTKRAWGVFATFWLVGLLVRGLVWLFGPDNHGLRQTLLHDMPWAVFGWPFVLGYYGSLAIVVLAGAIWLAGSMVAGYREPKAG